MPKSQLPAKITLGIFITVLIIFIAYCLLNKIQIKLFVPYGLIAAFISFYIFRESNRARKDKQDNRREYLNERRQEILNDIFKKNKESSQKDD